MIWIEAVDGEEVMTDEELSVEALEKDVKDATEALRRNLFVTFESWRESR